MKADLDLELFLKANDRSCLKSIPKYHNHSAWNSPVFQEYNNCYAYAMLDLDSNRTSKPQPGYKVGLPALEEKDYSCKNFVHNMKKDFPGILPSASNEEPCPCGYHKIFLALDAEGKDQDYHFYRKDFDPKQNRFIWSHKPGSGKAVQVDADGNLITNPLFSNRKYNPYDYAQSCGFFCVPTKSQYSNI